MSRAPCPATSRLCGAAPNPRPTVAGGGGWCDGTTQAGGQPQRRARAVSANRMRNAATDWQSVPAPRRRQRGPLEAGPGSSRVTAGAPVPHVRAPAGGPEPRDDESMTADGQR
jgi:hypothetical protein